MALHTLNKANDAALLATLPQLLDSNDSLLLMDHALPLAADHAWQQTLPAGLRLYALGTRQADWTARVHSCDMHGFVQLAASQQPVVNWH